MLRPFTTTEVWMLVASVQWTIALSLIALVGGSAGGLIIALLRTSGQKSARTLAAGFIQLFQGTPLLMQLFLVYFGMTMLGFNINPWIAAGIGLTLHASAFLGQIWRGAIQAVDRGQWEASAALGMTYRQQLIDVVLPQAVKVGLAPTVGFIVQLIKSTSLTAIIGFVELTRTGQIINNATFKPFLVFGIVAGLYFILCWPISLLASHLERRMSTTHTRTA